MLKQLTVVTVNMWLPSNPLSISFSEERYQETKSDLFTTCAYSWRYHLFTVALLAFVFLAILSLRYAMY